MSKRGENNTSIYLSIVIGSYNSSEALHKNIHVLKNYLSSKEFSWEVLIVDDGSTDNNATKQIAIDHNFMYLKNEVNLGKGAAIRKGMLEAVGKYRIFTDADMPYETNAIDEMLNYLDQKEFHLVIGDRTLEGGEYFTQVKRVRSLASKIFSLIIGRFIVSGMFDTQCGIKGFRDTAAKDIFSISRINGFAFDVEVIYISMKRNYDIKRIPVKLRSQDGSTVNVLKQSIKMILDLPKIILNFYRGQYTKKT